MPWIPGREEVSVIDQPGRFATSGEIARLDDDLALRLKRQ
jgi:hypothetical protein